MSSVQQCQSFPPVRTRLAAWKIRTVFYSSLLFILFGGDQIVRMYRFHGEHGYNGAPRPLLLLDWVKDQSWSRGLFVGMATTPSPVDVPMEMSVSSVDSVRFLSPLFRDTIHALVGGAPRRVVVVPGLTSYGGSVDALTRYSWTERGGIIEVDVEHVDPPILLGVYLHELGHLFEARNLSSDLIEAIHSRYPEMRESGPHAYASVSPCEHFAEVFSWTLMDILLHKRRPPAEMLASLIDLENRYPGVLLMAEHIFRQPAMRNPEMLRLLRSLKS